MRVAIVLLMALVIPAYGQSDDDLIGTPPSKTLERAIKLYDKHDFFSASVELQKVLEGQTGDDAKNKQRADFFMAKTLYNMGYYAAAAGRLNEIARQGTAHIYFTAVAKWMFAIYRVTTNPPLGDGLLAYRGTNALNDPILASVRDDFAFFFGRELGRRDVPKQEALAMLAQVSPDSPLAAQARIEIERVKTAPADRPLLESKLKAAASPPYARYAASRPNLANVPVDVFDAVIIPTACHESGPIAPTAQKVIQEAQGTIAKLRALEDNGELAATVSKMRTTAPAPGTDVVLAMLVDPRIADEMSWATELETELTALQKADKAWQTTQVAAEVLQELTVQQSIGQADLGKLERDRLEKLDTHLHALAAALTPSLRVDMPRELCGSSAVTLAAQPPVKPQSGCAGCATRDASGSSLVLLSVLFLRRRAARR